MDPAIDTEKAEGSPRLQRKAVPQRPIQDKVAKGPVVAQDSLQPDADHIEPSNRSFFARKKKLVFICVAIATVLIIIIGIGAGVGAKHSGHHSSGSSSSSGSGDDCTPPGGQQCETSGDCGESMFSKCVMACDGFSYCQG